MFKRFVKFFFSYCFKKMAEISLNKKLDNKSKVHGYTRLTHRTMIGINSHFNGLHIYGAGRVFIGKNFHSGKGLKILTQNHNYHGSKLPYDDTYIIKDVHIGDNVWVGLDVIILPGVHIGDGAIIQAGSVVSRDIESLAIVGGNPAVKFSSRDISHYRQTNENLC
ncbi:acyltransferase [Photobacterium sp. J15]|uniref:acyltransferase n=1 Tax=Photobacterium sp. J15 TaxID=265901 RepID=UPI0007E315B5|nr:acyltransferase [Photobacterium sp. J15]